MKKWNVLLTLASYLAFAGCISAPEDLDVEAGQWGAKKLPYNNCIESQENLYFCDDPALTECDRVGRDNYCPIPTEPPPVPEPDPPECSIDSDCAVGEVCFGGLCSPGPEPEPEHPYENCVASHENLYICDDPALTDCATVGDFQYCPVPEPDPTPAPGPECVVDEDCAIDEVCTSNGICSVPPEPPPTGEVCAVYGDEETRTVCHLDEFGACTICITQ